MIGKNGRTDNEAVFQVRDLAKIYKMGEVAVHALRGVDMELYSASWLFFLDRREAGNLRC